MEKPSKKFLDYCKGKVFLLSWKEPSGAEVRDRWVTFGEDAEAVLNYIKCSAPHLEDYMRFNPRSDMNDTDYTVAFGLNKELDISQAEIVVGEVVIFKTGGTTNFLEQLINSIRGTVGECNNEY